MNMGPERFMHHGGISGKLIDDKFIK